MEVRAAPRPVLTVLRVYIDMPKHINVLRLGKSGLGEGANHITEYSHL